MQYEYTQKDVPAECKMQMKRELITSQREPKTNSKPPEAGEGQALPTPSGSTSLPDNLTSDSKLQNLQRTLWLFGNPFGSDSLLEN